MPLSKFIQPSRIIWTVCLYLLYVLDNREGSGRFLDGLNCTRHRSSARLTRRLLLVTKPGLDQESELRATDVLSRYAVILGGT